MALCLRPALSVRRRTFALSLTIAYSIIALCLRGCETDTVSRFALGPKTTDCRRKETPKRSLNPARVARGHFAEKRVISCSIKVALRLTPSDCLNFYSATSVSKQSRIVCFGETFSSPDAVGEARLIHTRKLVNKENILLAQVGWGQAV
jgi:hypothetical protein